MKEYKKGGDIDLLISMLTKKGLKIKSERILYEILKELKKEYRKNKKNFIKEEEVLTGEGRRREKKEILTLLGFILETIEIGRPVLWLRNKKVGGIMYRLPIYLPEQKGKSIVTRWICKSGIKAERGGIKRRGKEMTRVLLGIKKREGEVLLKRDDVYKAAQENRAFLHYLEKK